MTDQLAIRADGGGIALAIRPHTDAELAALNDEAAAWSAQERIEWAVRSFAPHLSLAASMTDALLIDLAVRVDPAIEVVFSRVAGRRAGVRTASVTKSRSACIQSGAIGVLTNDPRWPLQPSHDAGNRPATLTV